MSYSFSEKMAFHRSVSSYGKCSVSYSKKKSEMKKDQNSRSANDIIKPLQKLIDMGKQN